jgi:hypothetical protein
MRKHYSWRRNFLIAMDTECVRLVSREVSSLTGTTPRSNSETGRLCWLFNDDVSCLMASVWWEGNHVSVLSWHISWYYPDIWHNHTMKTYWGRGGTAPHILTLGTRSRWAVRFTPRPIYPREKRCRHPLDWILGGPQSRFGCSGEKKNPLSAPAANRTPRSLVTMLTATWIAGNLAKIRTGYLPHMSGMLTSTPKCSIRGFNINFSWRTETATLTGFRGFLQASCSNSGIILPNS